MATDVVIPSERELSRSEEEEALLRKIRQEKEQLWYEIQVKAPTLDEMSSRLLSYYRIYVARS